MSRDWWHIRILLLYLILHRFLFECNFPRQFAASTSNLRSFLDYNGLEIALWSLREESLLGMGSLAVFGRDSAVYFDLVTFMVCSAFLLGLELNLFDRDRFNLASFIGERGAEGLLTFI